MSRKEILEYVIACIDRCAEDEVYLKDIFTEIYKCLDKLYKPIDEEKLDELAAQEADAYCKAANCGHINPNEWEIAKDCIKIGYRKAMEK